MLKFIIEDFRFTLEYKGSGLGGRVKALLSFSLVAMFFYRVAHCIYLMKIPVIPKLLWMLNFFLFKIDIDVRSKLYAGVYMPHPMGIVIGDGVGLFGRTKIMQNSTMGGNLGAEKKVGAGVVRQPQLMAGGFVGVNSVVVGPLIFDKPIFVCPNSIISKDEFCGSLYAVNKASGLSDRQKIEMRIL